MVQPVRGPPSAVIDATGGVDDHVGVVNGGQCGEVPAARHRHDDVAGGQSAEIGLQGRQGVRRFDEHQFAGRAQAFGDICHAIGQRVVRQRLILRRDRESVGEAGDPIEKVIHGGSRKPPLRRGRRLVPCPRSAERRRCSGGMSTKPCRFPCRWSTSPLRRGIRR